MPVTRRERFRALIYLGSVTALVSLVVLAVVFDRFAATGVLVILFLSLLLTYLIAPAVQRVRLTAGSLWRGRPLARSVALLAIYGVVALIVLPIWGLAGDRLAAAGDRAASTVPQHVARFIRQVRESERWPHQLGLPARMRDGLTRATERVSMSAQAEAGAIIAELAGTRRLAPWLALVPVIAFVLLTRWSAFRRSTTRVLPTPHLQWRAGEFLRQVNSVLAAYTRAQATASVCVGVMCWIGFALLRLPYPGTLGLAAGLLEMVPLVGPVAVAIVATSVAPGNGLLVLGLLAGLRVLQDYAIYPRIIGRATRLHPFAVVAALWFGGALAGIVGLCLAVPAVATLQVTARHWREYREIEHLVRATGTRARIVTEPLPTEPVRDVPLVAREDPDRDADRP